MPGPSKMTWDKSSPELVKLFEALIPPDPTVQKKQMFGWPCTFVNGNLCFGLHKELLLFRLGPEDQAAFLAIDGAMPFEPMPGRAMRGFFVLDRPVGRDRALLDHWVERSRVYTASLPPKQPKAKKASK